VGAIISLTVFVVELAIILLTEIIIKLSAMDSLPGKLWNISLPQI
jgi:hypothetical protein